ncbi:MAG: DUF2062 domain-containing protein [Phycisphaerae bacterium]
MTIPSGWRRVRRVVAHRILHLNDTPHRIALGVFLGFLVGWTPTLGLQVLIFLAVAAIVRANKISGLLPIMLTNPITAIPVYYLNWRIGRFVTGGNMTDNPDQFAAIEKLFGQAPGLSDVFRRLFEAEFWSTVVALFPQFGLELWVGCLVVGLVTGGLGYAETYYGVARFRAIRSRRRASRLRDAETARPRMPVGRSRVGSG